MSRETNILENVKVYVWKDDTCGWTAAINFKVVPFDTPYQALKLRLVRSRWTLNLAQMWFTDEELEELRAPRSGLRRCRPDVSVGSAN